jgi:hypothetical protein
MGPCPFYSFKFQTSYFMASLLPSIYPCALPCLYAPKFSLPKSFPVPHHSFLHHSLFPLSSTPSCPYAPPHPCTPLSPLMCDIPNLYAPLPNLCAPLSSPMHHPPKSCTPLWAFALMNLSFSCPNHSKFFTTPLPPPPVCAPLLVCALLSMRTPFSTRACPLLHPCAPPSLPMHAPFPTLSCVHYVAFMCLSFSCPNHSKFLMTSSPPSTCVLLPACASFPPPKLVHASLTCTNPPHLCALSIYVCLLALMCLSFPCPNHSKFLITPLPPSMCTRCSYAPSTRIRLLHLCTRPLSYAPKLSLPKSFQVPNHSPPPSTQMCPSLVCTCLL